MEMRHDKHEFRDSAHREQELKRFINFYNTVKPHAGLRGLTPFEALEAYFHPTNVQTIQIFSKYYVSSTFLPRVLAPNSRPRTAAPSK